MLTKKTTKKCKDGCKADMYQSGGAANYLEQILGAVNQGNPFTPKNEKASLLGYDTWLKDNGYTSFWDKANKQKEYANYVASNKSFNEQLPLGPNFGGLFELNQMATDEQLNKKDTLADYTKSISTYAPQGFAEEGGMADGQATNKFPSLQAILAGLPKEMKAKDKQKVAANAELELQQILGYKDNSPYKDLPSQDFNTDTLTMDGVSQALMAIANNGQTKLMQPNSGTHYFPGATQITEVPMAQQGARFNTRLNTLPFLNLAGISPSEIKAREYHESSINSKGYKEKVKNALKWENPNLTKKELEDTTNSIINERLTNLRNTENLGVTNIEKPSFFPNDFIVEFNNSKMLGDDSVNTHEFSHATTNSLNEMLGLEKAAAKHHTQGDNKYLRNPTEIKARLDQLRSFLEDKGVLTPGEQMTPQKMDESINLINKDGDKSTKQALNQLLQISKEDEENSKADHLGRMWNVITSVNDKVEVPMAQQGGQPKISNDLTELPGADWTQEKPHEFLGADGVTRFVKKDNEYYTQGSDGLWYPVNRLPMEKMGDVAEDKNRTSEIKKEIKDYQEDYGYRNDGARDVPSGIVEKEVYGEYSYPSKHSYKKGTSDQDYIYDLYKLQKRKGDKALRKEDVELLKGIDYKTWEKIGKRHEKEFGGEYQNGGGPNRQMIFNLFKQRPMGRYTDGGFSHRAPSYQFNLPVGNKTRVSGFIPLESLIPIQTEKKELIVLPTFDVVPVNAKQRHSQMSDDQVTDIVPENSYILSQFGQVDIYRSEADEVIIETENKPYNLYGVNPEPRVKTLGDIMSKKVMKPADLGRALTTKYKQIDNAGDPYTQQTNMANKETLSKYLQALIGLSEMDKARKGINNSMETQMGQGQLPQMVAANGGRVMKAGYSVPKAQDGSGRSPDPYSQATSLFSVAAGLWSDWRNRKLIKQNRDQSLAEIAKWRNQQLGLSNTGLGIGMASVFAQDPTVDPVLQQSGYLDSMQKGLPQQFLDYQQSRNLANRPDFSGLGAQESNALNTQYYSQTLNSQSGLALQAARDRAAMFNKYLEAKGQIQNFNIASRTNATNATRVNANNMISTAGGIGMGNITDRQNINTNALQSQLAARGQATSGLIQLNSNLAQSLANSAALGLQAYNSYNNNYSQDPNKPVPQSQLCQPPAAGCPQGSFWSYAQCRCI